MTKAKIGLRGQAVVLAAILSLALVTACSREVRVTRQMTWECVPQYDRPGFPNVQTVLMKYVENPRFTELEPGTHLCDQLKAIGRLQVPVQFVVFGNWWDGMHGYRIETINGMHFAAAAPWEANGSSGNGRFPLEGLIPSHKWR
jgi:hypothetical protein